MLEMRTPTRLRAGVRFLSDACSQGLVFAFRSAGSVPAARVGAFDPFNPELGGRSSFFLTAIFRKNSPPKRKLFATVSIYMCKTGTACTKLNGKTVKIKRELTEIDVESVEFLPFCADSIKYIE